VIAIGSSACVMPSIDPAEFFRPEAMENPHPLYARVRRLAPVCPLEGVGVHFVGSFAAVEEVVRRHEEFSANLTGLLMRGDDGRPRVVDLPGSGTANQVIATADEPDHAVQRRIVQPSLTASRVASLEPEVRAFASERVARFVAAGGGDWCDAIAEALPAFVLMDLLGMRQDELETARRWAMMGGDLVGGNFDRVRMQELFRESAAMMGFLARLFDGALATRTRGSSEALGTRPGRAACSTSCASSSTRSRRRARRAARRANAS
jgi:cytochrome P450